MCGWRVEVHADSQEAFQVQQIHNFKVKAEITDLRYCRPDLLVYATSDGRVQTAQASLNAQATLHDYCEGLDLHGHDFVSIGREGDLVQGSLEQLAKPKLRRDLAELPTCVRHLTGQRVAIGTAQGRVLLVDLRGGKEILRGSNDGLNCLAGREDHLLYTGDEMGVIRGWDLRRSDAPLLFAKAPPAHHGAITSLCPHPLSPTLLSAADDGSIALHQPDSQMQEEWVMEKEWLPLAVNAVDMVNSLAAAALDNGHLLLWRL